jgi:hypothetical protein
MSIRFPMLAAVSVLSGCTFNSDCPYGIVRQPEPARCMTRSEYYAAREKLRQSLDKTSPKADNQSWETQTKDRIEAIGDK